MTTKTDVFTIRQRLRASVLRSYAKRFWFVSTFGVVVLP